MLETFFMVPAVVLCGIIVVSLTSTANHYSAFFKNHIDF